MRLEIIRWVSAGKDSLKDSTCLLGVDLGDKLRLHDSNLLDVGANTVVFLARGCRAM